MLSWLFDKLYELKCNHQYDLVDKYKGKNLMGMIGYRKIYRCRKCLKTKCIDYYP